jgi:endonuclease/exonuclease/phosphatase family metal-dependent hydrolase
MKPGQPVIARAKLLNGTVKANKIKDRTSRIPAVKIVSYNIHYAIGKDDRYDLERVVDSLRGADIIALQEVERRYDTPRSPSQPEDIAALLPAYYWVYDAAFDVDCSRRRGDGSIDNRRRQHGQMLLSRWPILAKRYFPLPRIRVDDEFNMQMGVLEGIVDTPLGALRIYNLHFGSVAGAERQLQAACLLDLLRESPARGGAWTGPNGEFAERDWCAGDSEPPMPSEAILLGDYNMRPGSPEYRLLCGATDDKGAPLLTDLWARHNPGRSIVSWHSNPSKPGPAGSALLDYCLVTPQTAARATACWIDETAAGSDHQPLWASFGGRPGSNQGS